jgi:hypothetical protein
MDRVPESSATIELLAWIACERDAAWAAKLAILRAPRCEDIAHFGSCVREHERHADELALIARVTSPGVDLPTGPTFVTRDAFVVGAIEAGDDALFEAMERLEAMRIDRYAQRRRGDPGVPGTIVDALLERHLADARARTLALRQLRTRRHAAA